MAVLFSKEFNITREQMYQTGVFDVFLDVDSHFFINIKRLQGCEIPEFVNSYEKVNKYFYEIGLLLEQSSFGDKLYKAALSRFNFSEVSGINLGFSEGTRGAGFGTKLREKIIKDAFDIIKAGTNHPEIFQLVSLFEEKVGPDRISDMIAKILYDDIISYTRRVYKELNINQNNYSSYSFQDGILFNPYKNAKLLLLPEDILHKLPIARDWDDIDRVCSENYAIKKEMNNVVSLQWRKMPVGAKKEYLLENIFKDPEKLNRVIDAYKKSKVDKCDFYEDSDYFVNFCKSTVNIHESTQSDSFIAAKEILTNYKEWVELHRGAIVINPKNYTALEKNVQRTVHAVALMYCKNNNWDISPETDSGRGPVDFKISRGMDKTVIEIKLTSNAQCVHGLKVQIEEYAKSENTNKKLFVLVYVGTGKQRIEAVKNAWLMLKHEGKSPAEIIEINAVEKKSASVY